MIDLPTLQGWLEKLGYEASLRKGTTLRLKRRAGAGASPPPASPRFFLQHSENWIMLSMLPMLAPDEERPDDLGRRLLAANREMRVAKYAIDKNGDVVLCAELPTESLDYSELADALDRMSQYGSSFASEILRR